MENKELCTKCKGVCCKNMGCHYSPEDFEDLSYEGLKKEIDKGFISIDWWEGNPFNEDRDISVAFYLRIKNEYCPIIDPSWGGQCSLLTDTGCSLDYQQRPKGGRLLEPHWPRCITHYGKQESAIDWFKYNDILIQLFNHYK